MEKLLIVEDEQQISSLLEKWFHRKGFATAVASNGEQAIQTTQTDDYAVILLDLGLPIKDGWTVLKELRDRGNTCPVIVVTASDASPREILDAGANDYVFKPYKLSNLLTAVNKQIESVPVLEA